MLRSASEAAAILMPHPTRVFLQKSPQTIENKGPECEKEVQENKESASF
jgi:hypothetical protein